MTSIASAVLLSLLAITPPWEDSAPLAADPVAVARAAAAIDPPEGAPVDVLLAETDVAIDPQGRFTVADRLVYRTWTRDAARRWGSVARAWAPWRESRPEIRARVIGRDGVAHALDPARIAEAKLSDAVAGLGSERRVVEAALPEAEPGAVIEQVITVRDLEPREGGQVRRVEVGEPAPVRLARVTVEAPAGRPLRWALRGGLAGAPEERLAGGRRSLAWRWGPLPARGALEPLLPPEDASPPHLELSDGASWEAAASALSAPIDRALRGGGLAAELPAGARAAAARPGARGEAVQALLDWARARVRYDGRDPGESPSAPSPPAETLRRREAGGVDLSVLLAGALRAAGIPASVAFVRLAPDDPSPLPGLGEFDHAVVVAPGSPTLYLDPADPVTPAAELSPLLQGRLALVAAAGTTGLVRIPSSPPAASTAAVTRRIVLPESGWADAAETRVLTGALASLERARRRGGDGGDAVERDLAEVREHFAGAVDGQITLDGVDRSTGPVTVTMHALDTRWGATSGEHAEAVVSPGALLDWLPPAVRPPRPAGGGAAGDGNGDGGAAPGEAAEPPPRRGPLLLPFAYRAELAYEVVPPPGYEVAALPDARSVAIGPLSLRTDATAGPGGAVHVHHRLEVARRLLAPAEVDSLRAALAPLLDDQPRVRFDSIAARLLDAGDGRAALDELRRLAALHPTEARHQEELARALLRLGMGEAARSAARRAVALAPGSARPQLALAAALEHDAIGRWLAPGCDLEGAIAAQRRAAGLDANPAVRLHLGLLLEQGRGCDPSRAGARLDAAADVYRALVEEGSTDGRRALVAVLLRAGRFADALAAAPGLPDGVERRAALLAATAAVKGVGVAAAEAAKLGGDERAAALDGAVEHLVLARRYGEASRLLSLASPGTPRSAELQARAAALARVQPAEELPLDPKDPGTLPARLFRALALGGDAWRAVPEVAGVPGATGAQALEKALGPAFRRGLRTSSGLPERVALDIGLSLLEVRLEGDPAVGLRIVGRLPGASAPLDLVVLREPGGFRLITDEPTAGGIGAAALRRAEAGRTDAAAALLALARLEAGAPEEGGPAAVLAALLPEGRPASPAAVRLAAAALGSFAEPGAVEGALGAARGSAADPAERAAIGWALAAGQARERRYPALLATARELLAAAPASAFAFRLEALALTELDRDAELQAAAAARLRGSPGDVAAREALVGAAVRRGDAAEVVAQERLIVAGSRALPGDHNDLAWAGLFLFPLPADALPEARRAVELTGGREAAYLHTLACAHAAAGQPSEAIQVLRRAIEAGSVDDLPAPHDWLVVGMVAERYGLAEEAAAAYRRVAAPAPEEHDGLPSSELASRRLRALRPPGDPATPVAR